MSRATLRAALVSTYGGGQVAGLTDVHAAEKKITSANEQMANVGDSSGTLAFVFIETESERRRALTGTQPGGKQVVYDVGLVCRFRHVGTVPDGSLDAGIQAAEACDTTIENIKEAVRANRTLSGAVFQIGEGDTLNGTDIEIQSDFPTTDNDGAIHIWFVVKLKVIEWV